MSAESPRRRSQEGARVRPQPVSDKTILESVAGFINEVVPQVNFKINFGQTLKKIESNFSMILWRWPQ
jgi:hypothetical protein